MHFVPAQSISYFVEYHRQAGVTNTIWNLLATKSTIEGVKNPIALAIHCSVSYFHDHQHPLEAHCQVLTDCFSVSISSLWCGRPCFCFVFSFQTHSLPSNTNPSPTPFKHLPLKKGSAPQRKHHTISNPQQAEFYSENFLSMTKVNVA